MMKCPSCNSSMIWKGSMLTGGLSCPNRCEEHLPSSNVLIDGLKKTLDERVDEYIKGASWGQPSKSPDPAIQHPAASCLFVVKASYPTNLSDVECTNCGHISLCMNSLLNLKIRCPHCGMVGTVMP